MAKDGLLIGEVARQSGASRKALRIYEASGILPTPRRTASGYRVYTAEALGVLSFLRQARGLGFTLAEIKRIVAVRRQGRTACAHVRALVSRKLQEMDERLKDLTAVRDSLRGLLEDWHPPEECDSMICPKIERGPKNGRREDVALPIVHRVPGNRGRQRGRQGKDR
ncbi:MAG: heavy metal-responsive transcriptional regulator [Candidatus Rokuibacteriota bacterium]